MAAEPRYLSPEEYLALERQAATKSEYLDGRLVAMAGASENHSLLQSAVNAPLFFQLRRRGCQVHGSDMRVRIPNRRAYTYPDLTIVCGEPQLKEGRRDTLLNPVVISEILSPSTAMYDRTEKFARYRQTPRSANTCSSRRMLLPSSTSSGSRTSSGFGRAPSS